MNSTNLKKLFNDYLDGNEEQLERGNKLPGQTVTLEQAKILLDDVILYLEQLNK